MKIFISIASYKDPLLKYTITEAYNNAIMKRDLVFGIVDQSNENETIDINTLPFKDQIRYVRLDPQQSRGCCWARSIAQSLWNGEEYFFQIDSHMGFDPGWDLWFIKSMEELRRHHKKPIITGYPNGITAVNDDITQNIVKQSNKDTTGMLVLIADENNSFNDNNYYVGARSSWVKTENNFLNGYLLSANTLFTLGSAIEEVPYDPFLFFSGEEQSLALRYWTHGYNIFHGKKLPTYHYYGRSYRKVFWDETEDSARSEKWWEFDMRSKDRLKNIVTGNPVGKYGLGDERSLQEYIQYTGIDYLSKNCLPRAYDGQNIFDQDYRKLLTLS